MNYTLLLLLLAMPLFIALIHLLKIYFHDPKNNKLPPGPKRIPVFGNIFNLGEKPHRSFTDLAKIYGPIISVKLGSITTIIVSSSEVAREMLLKNDHVVSNRTINDSIKASNHDILSMSWLPVSQKWRHLRKIAATQLLSTQRLDSDESLRLAKVEKLVEYVQECCNLGLSVDIGRVAFTTILNLLSTTCFSKELLAHYSSSKSQEFKHLMWNIMEEMGRPNYVDYFPMLRFMDPFSVRRRLSNYFDKLTDVFKEIIDERLFLRKKLCGKDNTNDVLSSLLNLYEQNELSMGEIYHLLVDFFDAGTETTASTLEWAMAELVKNPNIMTKVQNEFQQVLGNNHRLIQESHIDKLPYFQAIIKETFRLHPSTALLPRKAEVDVSLYGYVMPKNAQILVNIWAIGRDPKVWDHPEVFEPERFMGRTLDFKGPDFELLTFGAGRRICPGIGFANRMLSLMLANLLHSFDWKLDNGMEPKDLDMEEKFGLTLQKLVPLQLIPISKK